MKNVDDNTDQGGGYPVSLPGVTQVKNNPWIGVAIVAAVLVLVYVTR